MKKYVLAASILLAMSVANAEDALKYTIQVKDADASITSLDVSTVMGTAGMVQSVKAKNVVRHITNNHELGAIENVVSQIQTGTTATISPVSIDAMGRVLTSVTYTVWSDGTQVLKGNHVIKIAHGEIVTLPVFDGEKNITIKVALAD